MEHSVRFIHDFPSCSRTYATLCIYHPSSDPQTITDILQIKPDSSHKAGDLIFSRKPAPTSGWFLETQDILESRDVRFHIEWLLDKINMKKKELWSLFESGYEIRVSCFWESSSGNGGPILDHDFLKRISDFPLDLHFDIWFHYPHD